MARNLSSTLEGSWRRWDPWLSVYRDTVETRASVWSIILTTCGSPSSPWPRPPSPTSPTISGTTGRVRSFTEIDFCVSSLQETDNYLSSLDEKMRKMLGNLKEKRFYNENKTERKRQSPNSLKIYKKSGEAVRLTEILRNFVMQKILFSGNQLTDKLATEYLDSIGDNSFYVLKYTVAEVLCLVSSIVQIVLTNKVRSYRNILILLMRWSV